MQANCYEDKSTDMVKTDASDCECFAADGHFQGTTGILVMHLKTHL